MTKNISTDIAIVVAANTLMLVCVIVWLALSPTLTAPEVAPYLFIFFLLSLVAPGLRRRYLRWRSADRCEFCEKKRFIHTDDTRWAEHHGLTACHSCGMKMHVTFGDPDSGTPTYLLH